MKAYLLNKKGFFQNKFFAFVGIVLYKISLDSSYKQIIYPFYKYSGFEYNPSRNLTIICWVLLLFSAYTIVKLFNDKDVFFSNVMVLFYLLSFVPTITLMAFMPPEIFFLTLFLIYWIVLIMLTFSVKNKYFQIKRFRHNNYIIYLFLALFVISIVYISVRYTGFRLFFKLSGEYLLRSEEKGYNYPVFFQYIIPSASSILPVLCVYFYFSNKKKVAYFIAFIIFLNYSIGGHKTVIFYLFLCVFGILFYKKNRIQFFAWALAVVNLICLLEFKIWNTFFLSATITRRVMFIPAKLNYWYFEFFTKNEIDYYKQSFLRYFGFESIYKDPIPRTVAGFIEGKWDMNANNGLFSDGFSNLGILGMLIHPILLIIVIKLMSSSARGIDIKFLFLPMFIVSIMIMSGTITSALLTNGLFLLSIVLLCLPRENNF